MLDSGFEKHPVLRITGMIENLCNGRARVRMPLGTAAQDDGTVVVQKRACPGADHASSRKAPSRAMSL
jgi:hypothetical protein